MYLKNIIQKVGKSHISLIILILSVVIPSYFLHGQIDDFLFQHVGIMYKYKNAGYIPITEEIFGDRDTGISNYYMIGIILSLFTNISPDKLPFYPILLPVFIVALYLLLKQFSNNSIHCSLVVFVFTTLTSNLSYLNFHPHGLGLIMFFILVYLITTLNKHGSIKINFLYIIIIISINYTSYKGLLWSIIFLLTYIFLTFFFTISNKVYAEYSYFIKHMSFLFIYLLVVMFSLNRFMFEWYLPLFNKQLNIFSGVINILNSLFNTKLNILSKYNLIYLYPDNIKYILIIREILIFLIIMKIMFYVIRNYKYRIENKYTIYTSLISTGVINLILYVTIGLFDLKFLTYIGIIGLLAFNNKQKTRTFLIASIILIMLNLQFMHFSISSNDAQIDKSYYDYIKSSYNWLYKYSNNSIRSYTDILTKTYYIKEIFKENDNKAFPEHFTISQLFYLLDINKTLDKNKYFEKDTLYIINYKLKHFSIANWRIITSFKNNKNNINNNININKIYTDSTEMSIYYRSALNSKKNY